jgi:hypothetical protein
MDEAANVLDCARSRISHIETGRNAPRKPDLEVLLRRYGAIDKLDVLEELRREGGKRGRWSTYRLPSWLIDYIELEADAAKVRIVELELVPGLLQTETYARQVHLVGGVHTAPPADVARRVAARMQRQQRLTDGNPLQVSAVISEAALERTLAHPDLAAEQLRLLRCRAQLPNVEVYILPFSAGLHRSMSGAYSLLSFAEGIAPDVAYQEYAVGGDLVDDEEIVQTLARLHDELRVQALGADESLNVISELINQTEGEEPSA